jgi:hypothetical protein
MEIMGVDGPEEDQIQRQTIPAGGGGLVALRVEDCRGSCSGVPHLLVALLV